MKKYKLLFPAMKLVNGLLARYRKDQSEENHLLLQDALSSLQEELEKVLR